MSKPPVNKPLNIIHWSVLGILAGAGLGIITVLILAVIAHARYEGPYNPSAEWEIFKWNVSVATLYGLCGAAFGGIVGFYIGVTRWAKQREES